MKSMLNITETRRYSLIILALLIFTIQGCKKLVEVDNPLSKVSTETVFSDDATATSAVTGMYVQMLSSGNFASGSALSYTAMGALSADDFAAIRLSNTASLEFYQNKITVQNTNVLGIWTSAYQVIYQANSIIESLRSSTRLSESVKNQLLGEALFVRAFCYFYLVNSFGDVPLVLETDYRVNNKVSRTSSELVYAKIVEDLLSAQNLMKTDYPSAERVRPNKFTVTAFLARVYLFKKEWQNAQTQSSIVINDSRFILENNLNNVFLASSQEAIWQLRQTQKTVNTWEGNNFIITTSTPNYAITTNLFNSFETGDLRKANWIKSFTAGSLTFYYPFKYKIRTGGPSSNPVIPLSEYSMVFRLAEQYLIRAEANAQLGKMADAINDIDKIRGRANLTLIQASNPNITKSDFLLALERERRSELFIEWGHRWLDLIRTGRANTVLAPLKTDWSNNDTLYPIPMVELGKNPNLGNQNPGY